MGGGIQGLNHSTSVEQMMKAAGGASRQDLLKSPLGQQLGGLNRNRSSLQLAAGNLLGGNVIK
jgi:hypothetical protein